MIKELYVKNIALISEANVEFDEGLNVLSGETGSGKSVILDSINFVLGSKADKTMIRYGEQESLVRAVFVVDNNSEAIKKLEEYDIDSDGEIIISRRLTAEGKGGIKINGVSVTATMLKGITQRLVDVHGQSEHFFLLNEANQLNVVDGLLGDEAEKIKSRLSELISLKKEYGKKIASLGGNESERARKLDLLDFQISEIEKANICQGEYENLKNKQQIIINAEKILTAIHSVKEILTCDGGCCDGLTTSARELGRISAYSEGYSEILKRIENVNTEINDIAETLSDLEDNISFDEQEALYVDDRISLLKSMFKKYGPDENSVEEYLNRAIEERNAIADSAQTIEKLTREINVCDKKIYELCLKLTALRKKVSETFCNKVESELKTLNINDAKFKVQFKEYNEENANLYSVNGSDDICFEFSANKGEPLKPLNKVISGGELSRFMLAVKTQLKNLNGISTYIFDEIDAGVSGYTACTMAEKFLEISKSTQILAVSHLPQVCAASNAQYLIYKKEEGNKTFTKVKKLSENEKIEEIVRLTGNISSESARRHAEELISQFRKKTV